MEKLWDLSIDHEVYLNTLHQALTCPQLKKAVGRIYESIAAIQSISSFLLWANLCY